MLVIPLLSLLAAFWAARIVNASELDDRFDRIDAWLRRYGAAAAGIVTLAVVWWVWGALSPLAVVHEESAHVLQGEIFARARFTAPSPVIPEFFEQPHVLVMPAVSSKFPPGHALLLALGAVVGFAPLGPLLLAAATGALLFGAVTRVLNPWIALLTWLVWLTTPMVLRFQPGYFPGASMTALLLASWWSLFEWRKKRKREWLLLAALAVGWGAITAPVTLLAFAMPIAGVVISDTIRQRRWVDFALAAVVGSAVFGLLPLRNLQTTGNWKVTPAEVYARDYVPSDKPGFGVDTTPPRRALSPVLETLYEESLALHEGQRLRNLPRTLFERVLMLGRDLWGGTQLILLPFTIAGLFFMTREVKFAALSAALAFVFQVPYASHATWTLPFLEIVPVVAALTGVGLWHAMKRFAPGVGTLDAERRPMLGVALVTLVLVVFALPTVTAWRGRHQEQSAIHSAFGEVLTELPSRKSIVFLRYAPGAKRLSLVHNFADPQLAPVWVVHDLGELNKELLRQAQDRTPYVFDEALMELHRF